MIDMKESYRTIYMKDHDIAFKQGPSRWGHVAVDAGGGRAHNLEEYSTRTVSQLPAASCQTAHVCASGETVHPCSRAMLHHGVHACAQPVSDVEDRQG